MSGLPRPRSITGLPSRAAASATRPSSAAKYCSGSRSNRCGAGRIRRCYGRRSFEASTTSKAEPGTRCSVCSWSFDHFGLRRAADVPVRAVVGDDHPVLLQRLEDDPRLPREARDRIALLQAEAHPHRRQVRVGLVAREVPRRPDVGAACVVDGEAERVVDPALRHVLVAREARAGSAARRRRRTSSRRDGACSSAGRRSRRSRPASRRRRSGRARRARRACSGRGRRSARAGRRPRRGRPRSRRSPGSGTGPCPTRLRTRTATRDFACVLRTTVIGIPIGPPSQSPEPKSAWTWSSSPIAATIGGRVGHDRQLVDALVPGARGREDRAGGSLRQPGGRSDGDSQREHAEAE